MEVAFPPRADERATACHWLLLRVAGAVPDDTIARCRAWLADGDLDAVARAITHGLLAGRVPLLETDWHLLSELFELGDINPTALSLLETGEDGPAAMFQFAPIRAEAERRLAASATDGPRAPEPVWPPPPSAMGPDDRVERVLVGVAVDESAVLAVWRAWRVPFDGAPWPPLRRVFVVETDPDANLAAIAGRVQRALAAADEPEPRVEVYPAGAELPRYQLLARSAGALLWARTPDPGVRLARLYDVVDPVAGPRMDPAHATVDEPERNRLLRYLRQGEPLLITSATTGDVIDASRWDPVPMGFRTDGYWVWNDAVAYYLDQHRLSPDPDLVEHIRARGYAPPMVDGAAMHRAAAALARLLADDDTER